VICWATMAVVGGFTRTLCAISLFDVPGLMSSGGWVYWYTISNQSAGAVPDVGTGVVGIALHHDGRPAASCVPYVSEVYSGTLK
jgi:hypothetical protein